MKELAHMYCSITFTKSSFSAHSPKAPVWRIGGMWCVHSLEQFILHLSKNQDFSRDKSREKLKRKVDRIAFSGGVKCITKTSFISNSHDFLSSAENKHPDGWNKQTTQTLKALQKSYISTNGDTPLCTQTAEWRALFAPVRKQSATAWRVCAFSRSSLPKPMLGLPPWGPPYSTAVNSAWLRLIHLHETSVRGYLDSGRMACIIKIG